MSATIDYLQHARTRRDLPSIHLSTQPRQSNPMMATPTSAPADGPSATTTHDSPSQPANIQSHPVGSPVEMSEIDTTRSKTGGVLDSSAAEQGEGISNTKPAVMESPDSSQRVEGSEGQVADSSLTQQTQPTMSRLDSIAIGPSLDLSPSTAPLTTSTTTAGPVLIITLLLTSGARHPYKIDEKYLNKRAVNVPGTTDDGRKDPFSISVYTLKELILREWREEWEQKPSSPSSIRLIYFGRLLDDKIPLKGMFPPSPVIILPFVLALLTCPVIRYCFSESGGMSIRKDEVGVLALDRG